jgi:hypothetical protein
MHKLRSLARLPSAILALLITILSLPVTAHGAMIGTTEIIAAEQITLDRAQLATALERDDVKRQLVALGVDVEQAKERVASLSAEEIAALNGKIADLPAGGDVLGLVVVVFLVLLFTDIAGLTDVFPFVKKHR